ncbi:23S ribosomal RNA methyltransferase Erm [Paenibacillus tarimensis]
MKRTSRNNDDPRQHHKYNFPGKHLLHHKRTIQEMIDCANLKKTDTVFDLGAGRGAITHFLGEKAGKVVAVENDPAFVACLQQKFDGHQAIQVIHRDIMKLKMPAEPFCVVANIPYSITTAILKMLLMPPSTSLQRAVLMVQLGAARGFTADPITDPRILTWRMRFDLKIVKSISRNHFSPPPSVDSAMLYIRRKDKVKVAPKHFQRFAAFAEYGLKIPRLSVARVLSGIFTDKQLTKVVRALKVDRHMPICYINEDQWGELFNTMVKVVEPYRWPRKR